MITNALSKLGNLKQKSNLYKTRLQHKVRAFNLHSKVKVQNIKTNLKQTFDAKSDSFQQSLILRRALGWRNIYVLRNLFLVNQHRYQVKIVTVLLAISLIVSFALVTTLQKQLEPYLFGLDRVTMVRDLCLNLGSALIGATAIAFSLIMFAMQVNVERMPHGLFRKFSTDSKLIFTFVATFSLATVTICLSLIPDSSWVAFSIVTSAWSLILILLLFGIAYRRALDLISPTKQIELLLADTKKNFITLDKAIRRISPMLSKPKDTSDGEDETLSKHDFNRVAYFEGYPNWTVLAERAILYCITFSRRYAEQGDQEVSKVALQGLVEIHKAYIKTKGKTFFSNNHFIENPLSSDSFLTNTLEHLRQNVQIGISRKDEQFIEENLHCLTRLTHVYLQIDYGDDNATRSHAHLVAGYLASAVETIVPHDMADVLIESMTLLGRAAQLTLDYDKPGQIVSLTEKITFVACAGSINKNYQVVTSVAVKQLALLTFHLLRCKSTNIRIPVKKMRENIQLIADLYLSLKDTTLGKLHSNSLGPYYSGSSQDSLFSWLTNLTKLILQQDADDKDTLYVIRNLSEWSDGMFQTEKEILLKAVERRSEFTFDSIHWILHVTKLLLAISGAKACKSHHSEKLKKSANWLISVLSWIPGDKDTVAFMEYFQLEEHLFEASLDAYKRDCYEEALGIKKLLLGWVKKTGKYQTGWDSLRNAICGLACLNLIMELSDEVLVQEIDSYVTSQDAPNFEIRSRTASDLHEEADKYRGNYESQPIDIVMAQVDQARLKVLLNKIAEHLLPETLNQTPGETPG
jgi:hypothetical protein